MQNLSCPVCLFPAEIDQGDPLSSCFNSYTVAKWLFLGLFSATFFTFWGLFCCWFSCLKCPPNIVLKCWLVFLSSRRLWCVSDELRSGVSYSAVGYGFTANESAVYIKSGVFKQKHTWKQGYVLIGWWKCWDQRLIRTCISPRSNSSLFCNSVFVATL